MKIRKSFYEAKIKMLFFVDFNFRLIGGNSTKKLDKSSKMYFYFFLIYNF